MIPFNSQENNYNFTTETSTETFTVFAGLLDVPEVQVGHRQSSAFENTDLGRQRVTYRKSYSRAEEVIRYIPDVFFVTSPVATEIDSFFVLDNGSVDLGSTDNRVVQTTTLGTSLTFDGSQIYPHQHQFRELSSNNFATVQQPGGSVSVTVNPALNELELVSMGRFLLAIYRYPTVIPIPANTPVPIQLGTLTISIR